MMDICNYICDEEIFNLLEKYDSSKRIFHLQKVTYYSNALINLLSEAYQFNDSDKAMLKYSSLLHDIGYFINERKHHSHSKYIILTDGIFDKLPLSERNILAILVASHRKKLDKEVSYYSRREQRKIIELVAILRLADGLDYGKDYILENAYIDNNQMYLKSIEYPDMKSLKKLNQKAELFKDTFNLEIQFS